LIELSYLHAIILGVVQGLTEFLPVSSSAHLALTQKLLGIDPSSGTVLLFDLLTHIGTLLAMALVFGTTVQRYLVRLVAETRTGWKGSRAAWRFLWLGVLAMIPTGVIGLVFKDLFEDSFNRPRQIGVELCATGVLLGITARLARGRIGWRRLAAWHGLVVGLAQAFAILPGVSRSGATICTATYCGIRRRWAAWSIVIFKRFNQIIKRDLIIIVVLITVSFWVFHIHFCHFYFDHRVAHKKWVAWILFSIKLFSFFV